jgi:predicted deacetylase
LRVLISLHDVTPFHRHRLERAEQLLSDLRATEVLYLLVPDYHGRAPVAEDAAFGAWCRRTRPFQVRWALHGHFHQECPVDAQSTIGLAARLKRRLLTDGEAEFLGLRGVDLDRRLASGCEAFAATVRARPTAFVAPAWLASEALPGALSKIGIRYTENHLRVFDVEQEISRTCPVITWSTRTALRRRLSGGLADALVRRWRGEPALRIAIHPYDFDHPRVEACIRRTLTTALDMRICGGHADLWS